jgi:hypothetical protein
MAEGHGRHPEDRKSDRNGAIGEAGDGRKRAVESDIEAAQHRERGDQGVDEDEERNLEPK